jgi:hypothetical protein
VWVHVYVLDPLERAASTFVQQFATILLATGAAGLAVHQNWAAALDVSAFAFVASLLTSLLTAPVPKLNKWWDLIWRVVKTGLQSFSAVLVAGAVTDSVVHASWSAAVAAALPTMMFAFIKGLAAMAIPETDGASLLPPPVVVPDDPAELPAAA